MNNPIVSDSLVSLSESSLRPKRTSYSNMSTWFYMKEAPRQNTEIFYEIGEILVKKRPITVDAITNTTSKSVLPQIVVPYRLEDKLTKNEDLKRDALIKETLMDNWSKKREANNKPLNNWAREGRGGGVWNNVRESLKEDGNRQLFIQGNARSYQNLHDKKPFKEFGSYVHQYDAHVPVRRRVKLSAQTKHSIEYGHWNVVR